jgi:hypothetical protein
MAAPLPLLAHAILPVDDGRLLRNEGEVEGIVPLLRLEPVRDPVARHRPIPHPDVERRLAGAGLAQGGAPDPLEEVKARARNLRDREVG